MTGLQVLEIKRKTAKRDICTIQRHEFSTPELRTKYFRANNRDLDRLHLPEMTAEVYEPIANEEFANPRMDKANLKFETASKYYIRKAQLYVLAYDLGVSPKTLDSSNYIWNEDYYIHSNFYINMHIADELYRENGDDERDATAYTVYIKQDPRSSSTDVTLWNSLYKMCFKAITHRKAMLMHKIPQCLSFLVNVLEYTNGFTENATGVQSATLKSYAQFFLDLLNDKAAAEFIKGTNDIEVFASYEATAKDYIETYRSMLRRMTGCSGVDLENLRDVLSTIEDPYIDLILEETSDPEDWLSGGHLENEDGEQDIEEPEEI